MVIKMSGFDDIPVELQELIDEMNKHKITESKWIKSMSTRMRVFNTQIFENILEGHCKDNAEMNYNYMEKTFNKLDTDAYYDESISHKEYYDFGDQFEVNRDKVHAKELKDDW